VTRMPRWLVGPAFFVCGWLGYFVLARLADPIAPPSSAAVFWPPAGMLAALAIITHKRHWPWWIGGAAAEVFRGSWHMPFPRIVAALVAVTLLPVVSGLLIRVVNGDPPKHRSTRARVVNLSMSVVGSAASAIAGGFVFASPLTWSTYRSEAWSWFIGDAVAVMVMPPLVMAVLIERRLFKRPAYCIELAALCTLTFAIAEVIFETGFPTLTVLMPPMVLAAYRLEVVGASATLFVAALAVSVATAQGTGPFAGPLSNGYDPMKMTQVFIVASGLTVLLLSGEVARVRGHAAIARKMALIAAHADESARDELVGNLHDGPVQTLSALALRLETRQLDGTQRSSGITDGELVGQLRATTSQLRTMMFDLAPGLRSSTDLDGALRREAAAVFVGTAVKHSIGMDAKLELRGSTASTIYRIVREAIANVLRHAEATIVTIDICAEGSGVRVSVKDNGNGADADLMFVPRAGHRGLLALRARVIGHGGWLRVDSEYGQGTQLQAWLPNLDDPMTSKLGPSSLIA
jgi:signal transduction histidine kinase